MLFSRLQKLDWALVGGFMVLAAVSLLTLASYDRTFFLRQLIWYGVAFVIIIFGSRLPWSWLLRWSAFRYGAYWAAVFFLVISNLQSTLVRGTKSWLSIGGFQFEPAEFAKFALVIFLAGFFTKRYVAVWRTKNLFISLCYTMIPAFLIAVHPDLGSTIIVMSIWLGFMLMSGVNKKRFLIGLAVGVGCLILLWTSFLKPYQKDRLTGFLFPERDPLGINYNVIQSKIAIGSAGLWGKGFGQGTQIQFHFLPEAHTDFIFAAFTEEWGIAADAILLLTFFFIFVQLTNIGLRAGSNEEKFVVLGSALILFIQFLINVGSNLGLVPVTGITLPFVSYGGSSLLTIATLISIIQHIKIESSG